MQSIPVHIQKKMHFLAKLSCKAMMLDEEIDAWFQKHGYETSPDKSPSLRNYGALSLTELSKGNDITEKFVQAFEAGGMSMCIRPTITEKKETSKTMLYQLELSSRLKNILWRAGFEYIEKFDGMASAELRGMKGLGPVGFEELYQYFKKIDAIHGNRKNFTVRFS